MFSGPNHVSNVIWRNAHRGETQVLEKYLAAYQRVLKNTKLATVFFDAFAGTGEIPMEAGETGGLFQDVEEAEPFIEGSARRALGVDPPFSRYVFVEKSKRKAAQLERLRADFPNSRRSDQD